MALAAPLNVPRPEIWLACIARSELDCDGGWRAHTETRDFSFTVPLGPPAMQRLVVAACARSRARPFHAAACGGVLPAPPLRSSSSSPPLGGGVGRPEWGAWMGDELARHTAALDAVRLGGGAQAVARHRARGKRWVCACECVRACVRVCVGVCGSCSTQEGMMEAFPRRRA